MPPPAPPPDDVFKANDAYFDEASGASFSSEIPEEIPPDFPRSRNSEEIEKIRAAENTVPAALRKYLADRFQTRFERIVSGEKARIFSVHGEITADTQDASVEDSDESVPESDE